MPIIALLAASLLVVLQGALVAPSLPAIERAFAGAPHAALLTRLVLPAPALAIGLTAPWIGLLGLRIGRRRLYVLALLLYAAGGAASIAAPSLPLLLAARFVLGIGAGAVMLLVLSIIGDEEDGDRRARLFSLQMVVMAAGSALGASGGGALAELSWRVPFAIYPLSLLLLFWLPEPARGEAALAGPTGLRAIRPPRAVVGVIAIAALLNVAGFVIPVQGPFLFVERFGIGSSEIGLYFAGYTLCISGGSLLYPHVRRRLRPKLLYPIFLGSTALLVGWFAWVPSLLMLAILLLLLGVGVGILNPTHTDVISQRSDNSSRLRAMSAFTASVFLAQFLAPLFSQPFVTSSTVAPAFLASGVVIALLALASPLLLGWPSGRPQVAGARATYAEPIAPFDEETAP